MKDTLYNQRFINSQGQIVEKLVWSSNMDKEIYPEIGGEVLQPYYEEDKSSEGPMLMTRMSKAEIRADRKKRSTAHFKKEILPTLNKKDQSHFKQKFSKQ